MKTEDLTWREQEILALLEKRLTNREIAARLHLAESTVKDYVSNILGKLYVRNRRQAVERGKELGLLEPARKEKEESPAQLPSFPEPFIGRSIEKATVREQLTEYRLVTILGPGGVGKTRLAVQVAEEVREDFEHGVFVVWLAPVQQQSLIVQAIAEALKFPLATSEEPIKQLIRHLRTKQMLLVLDNMEHLLGGAAILEQLLQFAPNVKILTTSRESLNLPGEARFMVGGMSLPESMQLGRDARSDAMDLFVQTARRFRASFKPSEEEVEVITAICLAVQGLPLAVELAAAWLNVLSLEEVRKEVEESLDFLTGEGRATPDRHRSMRAVFEHSWTLMTRRDQSLFLHLSVFNGGFTRHAARKVAGADLPDLSRLVNKSILQFDPEIGRFKVHELLRQYALERLQEQKQNYHVVSEAHAAYYADFMQNKWAEVRGTRQLEAYTEIDADMGNIRVAWRHLVGQENATQLQKFLNTFLLLYWIRGWNLAAVQAFGEAAACLEPHRDQPLPSKAWAHARANQAFFMTWLGKAEEAYPLIKESLETIRPLEDPLAEFFVLHALTLPAFYLGKAEEERWANQIMAGIAASYGDPWLRGFSYFLFSVVNFRDGTLQEAERLAKASLEEGRRAGDLMLQSLAFLNLGHVATGYGDLPRARKHYLDCRAAAGKLNFRWAMGNSTKYLGQTALDLDEYDFADTCFRESLEIAQELGLEREIANLCFDLARLRTAQDRFEEAVELIGFVVHLPASRQDHFSHGPILDKAETLLASLKDRLSSETVRELLKRGSQFRPDRLPF